MKICSTEVNSDVENSRTWFILNRFESFWIDQFQFLIWKQLKNLKNRMFGKKYPFWPVVIKNDRFWFQIWNNLFFNMIYFESIWMINFNFRYENNPKIENRAFLIKINRFWPKIVVSEFRRINFKSFRTINFSFWLGKYSKID